MTGAELARERKRLLDALEAYREERRPYRVFLGSLPGIPFDRWAMDRIGRIGSVLKSRKR